MKKKIKREADVLCVGNKKCDGCPLESDTCKKLWSERHNMHYCVEGWTDRTTEADCLDGIIDRMAERMDWLELRAQHDNLFMEKLESGEMCAEVSGMRYVRRRERIAWAVAICVGVLAIVFALL